MSDRDTLTEPTPVGYVHVERTGPGWRLVEDEGMAPDASLIAAGWANEAVGVVYLHDEVKGWRPAAREITTAAQADALPVGTILFHVDCPNPDPCIWRRACSPSEVEDEIDGGTFDHIHWAAWGDEDERYDGEDLEGHADCGGPLLVAYVPTEEAGRG
ncbi:hypothetical protein ACFO5K_04450 [Nocardia halotolerans]|uniref:Uncharacterized protein n=1 Tax=Nocardia halotolerans TaxID=1755878 RepID=A0ABV8VE24_9NOCA